MIKGKRRDEDTGENIQDNNGTKMATAPAMGRPLASRPPPRPSEPWMSVQRFHSLSFDRMTTGMTRWNRQADLRRHHHQHHRYATTVSSLSTSASPPLPSNHQTLRRSGGCLPALHPEYLLAVPSNNTFSCHFLSFSGPFHHGLLALNIGLSWPSKAAHQLP